MKILKYDITKDHKPILFGKNVLLSDIWKDAIKAGFLIIYINAKQLKYRVTCFGESTRLKLQSDKVKDRSIIKSYLNKISK